MYISCLSEVYEENGSYIFSELPLLSRKLGGTGGR